MAGSRSALVIASDDYADAKLRRLRAPARDAAELARVLRDPEIGDFDVQVSANEPEHVVRRKLAAFFQDRGLDDLLLLHLSCHGVKDDDGRLYFATADTELGNLEATAVPSDFVNRQMTRSRSRRIVLLLDCCYSGAFASGLMARAGDRVDLRERFDGRGRIVLTASSAMEYAFEGDELSGSPTPSVFTSALVRGLETGEADRDQDGWVSVEELYDYAFDEVRKVTPSQTPGKWTFDVQGDLYLAHSSLGPVEKPVELSPELHSAMQSSFAHIRAGAVAELAALLRGPDPGLAGAAREALGELAHDDSRRVSDAADSALAAPAPPVAAPLATTPSPPAGEAPARAEPSSLVPAQLALAGAVLVLLSFVLSVAYGDTLLRYLFANAEWGVLFVYSPIELVPAGLAAGAVGIALLRHRIHREVAGGALLGMGLLASAAAVAIPLFFDFNDAVQLVPLLGGILLVAAGALLVRSSSAAGGQQVDSRALWFGIAGAALVFASIFLDYEEGTSLASVGAEYWLEPLVAVVAIAAALGLLTVGGRPVVATGLLLAVGGMAALHGVSVFVAAVGGGSSPRSAGIVGLAGGALVVAAGVRAYPASRPQYARRW